MKVFRAKYPHTILVEIAPKMVDWSPLASQTKHNPSHARICEPKQTCASSLSLHCVGTVALRYKFDFNVRVCVFYIVSYFFGCVLFVAL